MMGKGWGVVLGVALGAAACGGTVSDKGRSPSEEEGGAGGSDPDGSGGSRDGSGGSSDGTGGSRDGSGGGSNGGADGAGGLPIFSMGGTAAAGGSTGVGGGVCGVEVYRAELLPVDLFLMFDQSSSMGEFIPGAADSWWSRATEAVGAFVDDPRATDIGVGIQYFPLNGVAPASCTAPYSTPEVPIQLLPGAADAIKASLAAHGPSTFTPTGPALQGALDYMRSYARPGRAAAVVLITDGFPTECEPRDIASVADIARAALEGAPSIRTYVVGLGQGLGGLGEIARAGGSEDAFLIEDGNLNVSLVDALLGMASPPLRCELEMPVARPGETIDPSLVSLQYTPDATGITEEIPKVQSRDDCALAGTGNQGWYYDHPTTPTRILVCAATCQRFTGGTVSIAYGCGPTTGFRE